MKFLVGFICRITLKFSFLVLGDSVDVESIASLRALSSSNQLYIILGLVEQQILLIVNVCDCTAFGRKKSHIFIYVTKVDAYVRFMCHIRDLYRFLKSGLCFVIEFITPQLTTVTNFLHYLIKSNRRFAIMYSTFVLSTKHAMARCGGPDWMKK